MHTCIHTYVYWSSPVGAFQTQCKNNNNSNNDHAWITCNNIKINMDILATRMGFLWSSTGGLTGVSRTNYAQTGQHDRKCRTKRRTLTRIKLSARWQSLWWGRIGSPTPNNWTFTFLQMELRNLKRRRLYFWRPFRWKLTNWRRI